MCQGWGGKVSAQHMHDTLTVKLELKLRRHIFHMCVVVIVEHAPAQIVGLSINQSSIIKSLLCCFFDALRHASVWKVALFFLFWIS